MKIPRWISVAPWASLIALSAADDVVYVTDLTIYTLLVRRKLQAPRAPQTTQATPRSPPPARC